MPEVEIFPDPPVDSNMNDQTQVWLFEALTLIKKELEAGQESATFTTNDGKTVTVSNGKIVSVTP